MKKSIFMTPDAFEALATLCGMHEEGKTRAAMRMVCVERIKPAEAARRVGLPSSAVTTAKKRMLMRIDLMRRILAGCIEDGAKT